MALEILAHFVDSNGAVSRVTPANPLPVTSSGGGGGGAVTVADGADVAQGTTTDLAYVSGAGTGISIWKAIFTKLGAVVLGAGSAIIGKVGIDQTTPGTTNAVSATNLPTTVDTNSGVKSASTLRMVLATDQPALTNALKVDGSAVVQPVSASSLPLPTGAATAAKQPALGTAGAASADVLTIQGIASMTKLLVTPDSVALPANQSVNVAQINGVTPLMGNGVTGTGSPRVTVSSDNSAIPAAGQGATAASVPAGATLKGARGATANPSAVTDGQMVAAMADKLGRQVTSPFAIRDQCSDQTTSLSNTTAETTIVTAIASIFNDLLSLTFANTGTSATEVSIRDTTGGSVRYTIYVPAGETRGIVFSSPLKQATVNTNWTAQCATATTAMKITAQFAKNI